MVPSSSPLCSIGFYFSLDSLGEIYGRKNSAWPKNSTTAIHVPIVSKFSAVLMMSALWERGSSRAIAAGKEAAVSREGLILLDGFDNPLLCSSRRKRSSYQP